MTHEERIRFLVSGTVHSKDPESSGALAYVLALLEHLDQSEPLIAQLLREGEDSLSEAQKDALRHGLTPVDVDWESAFVTEDFKGLGDALVPPTQLYRVNTPPESEET